MVSGAKAPGLPFEFYAALREFLLESLSRARERSQQAGVALKDGMEKEAGKVLGYLDELEASARCVEISPSTGPAESEHGNVPAHWVLETESRATDPMVKKLIQSLPGGCLNGGMRWDIPYPKRDPHGNMVQYTVLVGDHPDSNRFSKEITVGFMAVGPAGTLYPPHHHPAVELFVPLTEPPAQWWDAQSSTYVARPAGELIYHEAHEEHGVQSGYKDGALLALWVWTGDTSSPTQFIDEEVHDGV